MKVFKSLMAFSAMLTLSAFMTALTPTISLADGNPNCSVNWVNGACGVAKSDASHSNDSANMPQTKKECDHGDDETPAKGV